MAACPCHADTVELETILAIAPPILAVAVLLLLAGAVMLRRGVRGRAIDDHPVCARCDFDLIGVYPGSSECPECGSPLTAEVGRSVRYGNRVRRPRLIWPAVAMIALALGLGGVVMVGSAAGWRTWAPTWYLRLELGGVAGDEAMKELLARQAAGSLSAPQTVSIAEAVLNRQGDATLPWAPGWGDFVENAWTAGVLSAEQTARYVRQAAPLSFKGRAMVEENGKWPYRLVVGTGRCGTGTFLHYETRLAGISLGEREIVPPGGRMSCGISARGWSSTGSIVELPGVAAGEHTVRATWKLSGFRGGRDSTPDAAWEETFQSSLHVVPAGGDVVDLVRDDSLRDPVEASIEVKQLELDGNGAQGYVYFNSTPIDAAFDVFWRYAAPDGASREVRVGGIACVSPPGRTHGVHFTGQMPEGAAPNAVDVILRPSAAIARTTPEIMRIWGGEIVFRAVPVQVAPAAATQRPN